MRADLPSSAYQAVSVVSKRFGPVVGFGFAYRLASIRVSRLGALLGVSLIFYFA